MTEKLILAILLGRMKMKDGYISKAKAIEEVNCALDRETILFSFVRKVAISALKKNCPC